MSLSSSSAAPDDVGLMELECFWALPDELLLFIFCGLPVNDVASLALSCKRFHFLTKSRAVQATIRVGNLWPTPNNRAVFERMARAGSFDACVKLGVSSLYGEGLVACPEVAGEMLTRAECLTASPVPFSWLLFRPPWSSDNCCKAVIFKAMEEKVAATEASAAGLSRRESSLVHCVAKTFALDGHQQLAKEWFHRALNAGCTEALIELHSMLEHNSVMDHAERREVHRLLQQHAGHGNLRVLMALSDDFAHGRYGDLREDEAMSLMRDMTRAASASPRPTFDVNQLPLDKIGKMRCILVDWLIEVVDLKSYSRDTLFMAVSLVDRVLGMDPAAHKTLQLLGVSCMVIAGRVLEREVVTIREAAWLTDNAFTYEQVVRAVGGIICSAEGDLNTPTHLHFLRCLIALSHVPAVVAEVMMYVSDLTLLTVAVGTFAPATMAAAVFALTQLSRGADNRSAVWPEALAEWTGLRLADLLQVMIVIHVRCFQQARVVDHRGIELQAVNARFEQRTGLHADSFAPVSKATLDAFLAAEAARDIFIDDDDVDDGEDGGEVDGEVDGEDEALTLAAFEHADCADMDCSTDQEIPQSLYHPLHQHVRQETPSVPQPPLELGARAANGAANGAAKGAAASAARVTPYMRGGKAPATSRAARRKSSPRTRAREAGDTPINVPMNTGVDSALVLA